MEDSKQGINKKGQFSFLNLVTVALILGVFVVATISFGSQIAIDNNATQSITDDPEINQTFVDFTDKISEANTDINASRGKFFGDIPIVSSIVATVTVIFGVIPSFFDLMIGSYNLVADLVQTKIGVPKIILNLFSAIIIFIGVMLAWRVYKAGS